MWVENESRIEMHLVSKRDQTVHLGGEKVRIGRGEHLRTEYCHKYTLDTFQRAGGDRRPGASSACGWIPTSCSACNCWSPHACNRTTDGPAELSREAKPRMVHGHVGIRS